MTNVQGFGRTLPSLLIEAVRDYPDQPVLYQWQKRTWESLSAQEFQKLGTELALGLLDLGLERGDRIGLLLHSNCNFCLADVGSLLAGLVDVPIDLTQTLENIVYIIDHSGAKALIVADLSLLDQILPYLGKATALRWLIVADSSPNWLAARSQRLTTHKSDIKLIPPVCLRFPTFLGEIVGSPPPAEVPDCLELLSLEEIQLKGRTIWQQNSFNHLLTQVNAKDLATIIYIASDRRQPQGVMLNHENIVTNVITAFSSHPDIGKGGSEVALSFLPLTHIFARAFFYGHLWSGHRLYFSDPNHVMRHFSMVKPTIVITVPRLLEKVYQKIQQRGQHLKKWQKWVFNWGMKLAHRYQIGRNLNLWESLQLKLAQKCFFSQWRAIFGGNLKALISGGAALDPQLANIFTAAGIPLLQGYGLTETSGVVTYTRGIYNRAGTVGIPMTGVELAIADDGEVLIKAPFVSSGYYQDPEKTSAIFADSGWLHTGDLGEITSEGLLKLTGVKKAHFKLSTGKYVSAYPLENQLEQSPLILRAIALAPNHKFCAMLIFPNLDNLAEKAQQMGLYLEREELLQHSCIIALYQTLIDETNCHLPYWSNVRKFQLIPHIPDRLTDAEAIKLFSHEIALLYHEEPKTEVMSPEITVTCPTINPYSCPAYAQSLH